MTQNVLATDAEIIARVRECCAAGETLAWDGGVAPETAAEGLPIVADTVKSRCNDLAKQGRLEKAVGFDANRQQRVGYAPVHDAEMAAETAVGGAD